MAGMDANSVDAVVTDPPYGLAFMGKHWDHGLPGVDFWTEALRVLKPSHYLLAFGGTRTWHRLACALEDAGFEIRDTLMWLYGSGFPKGTACLKPAWEPIILARKPGPKRALGIEECRVQTDERLQGSTVRSDIRGGNFGAGHRPGPDIPPYQQSPQGRWPANLILDEEAGVMLDGMTGTLTSGVGAVKRATGAGWKGNALGSESRPAGTPNVEYGDSGGASRFFYCAKASRSERNRGCEGMEGVLCQSGCAGDMPTDDQGRDRDRFKSTQQNHHPTVKPVALMRWLVRLVAYPGDTVLDPFLGSGTTGVACVEEGREFIGIEREAEYIEIARRRIEAAAAQERMPV